MIRSVAVLFVLAAFSACVASPFDLDKVSGFIRACAKETVPDPHARAVKIIEIVKKHIPEDGEPHITEMQAMELETKRIFPINAEYKMFGICMKRLFQADRDATGGFP